MAELVLRDDFHPEWINKIIDLHNKTEMKRSPEKRESLIRAYQSRFAVITCWKETELIGFGTMISDGELYSAIFDVVIDPAHQKQGIGRRIMDELISRAPQTYIHLTSTFGNEEFYQKLGFQRHKTAFAKYPLASDYLEP